MMVGSKTSVSELGESKTDSGEILKTEAVDAKPSSLDFLTLFFSAGTLVCCALPALLVAIGAGSVVASLFASAPALVWILRQKIAVFGFAGFMLLLSGVVRWKVKNRACPVDMSVRLACSRTKRFSTWIYIFSWLFYVLGVLFTFILPHLI